MAKRLAIIALTVIMILGVFGLTACEEPEATSFEIGFGGRGAAGKFNDFFCGAKSDTVIFNTDDIKIDFYFGWANLQFSNINGTSNSTPNWSVPDGYERIAIAAYFYGYGNSGSGNMTENEFADYHNIEGYYFIKEFTAEEFFTEQYKAVYSSRGLVGSNKKTEYNYHEIFTVPMEILKEETGQFYFGIFDVLYSLETNLYFFNSKRTLHDDVRLSYENKANGKVTVKGFAQK